MNAHILNTTWLAGSFLGLFGIAEILYHKMNVKVEITRKLVHLGTGILTLLFPIYLDNHWLVLLLCGSFALILIASLKFNLLQSINAIERYSIGSLAYPVSVFCCYLVYEQYHLYYFFYIPVLILAICDPLAALFGKRWPVGKFQVGHAHKTLMGSCVFFISAAMLCATLFMLSSTFNNTSGVLCITIASITTIAEAISGRGYDNLTIPLSAVTVLIAFHQLG